ncbi:MAG: hypothetical protein ACHQVS_00120 [Candidatus Babeliales bacterium]
MKFLSFFVWRDAVEIALLALIVYYLSLWLKKDRQKNLLFYFYGYCISIAAAYLLHLTTISHLLVVCSPLIIMLFVLIHQETLQKNFVALRTITPARQTRTEWLDSMMQTVVTTMNNHTNIICVIERSQALDDLIYTPLPLRADISQGALSVFLTSQLFDATTMLWLNTEGMILGINTTFKTMPGELIPTDTAPTWKHEAIFFTTKTDALLFKTNAEQRTLDIIVHGKEYGSLTTRAALHLLKKYTGSSTSETQGVTHDHEHTKNRPEQPHA